MDPDEEHLMDERIQSDETEIEQETPINDDLLVEEVSIDGMCGVY